MPELTLIKGGKENSPEEKHYKFVSAMVTDTRLMGVLGLRVHFLVSDNEKMLNARKVYMFFYYDIEEAGLDTFSVFELYDKESVELATQSCFGGLGAVMQPVEEKEAVYLIQSFIGETKRRNQPLPENTGILDFILSKKIYLTEDEVRSLNLRMCTRLNSNYEVVNYYLMRIFGMDSEGADLLKSPNALPNAFGQISLKTHATFLKNTVEEFHNNDGRVSYMSESLVETENSYYIVISDIRIEQRKVVQAQKIKEFEVSLKEASMLLSRHEFVTIYKILVPLDTFDMDFLPFTIGTTRTQHECGTMYMEFKDNNDHVNSSMFRLDNDIQTLFFVSDFGELIVCAYSVEAIAYAEECIEYSGLGADVDNGMKFRLANSVIYDFAESGCASFKEFMDSLE